MTSDGTSGPGAPWVSSIAPAFSRSEPSAGSVANRPNVIAGLPMKPATNTFAGRL